MSATTSSGRPARLAYPPIEPRPQAVEFGGGAVRYQDPFRWLEEDADSTVAAWQTAQDDLAQAYLARLPASGPFAKRLAAIGETEEVAFPTFAGGRWFFTRVPEDQDLSVVEVSDSPTGPGRRLVDLNAMRTNEPLALQGALPSPDGRKVMFAWTAGGREEPDVRIIDVDSGKVLVERLQHTRPTFFAWLPDSSGLLYLAMDTFATKGKASLFRLNLDQPTQPIEQTVDISHPVARPGASSDGRHVLLWVDHLAPRVEYILDTLGDNTWQPFLKGVPGIFRGDILGDRFIAITDDGAPCGRLISIPLATPTQRDTWKEIVPASDNVLSTVLVTGGRAVLLDLVDTYSRLRVYSKDGSFEGEIPLPGRGMVNSFGSYYSIFNMMDPMARAGEAQVIFAFSSPTQSPSLHRADVATRKLTQLNKPARQLDAQVLDLAATSADGARVGYHVIARRDLDLSKPHPTVLHGYGGFNVAVLPGWFGSIWAAWIEAGGVFVLSHLRGGGEYGTPGWETGRLEHKQNSFNDVYATAEDLIRRGITTRDQLGVIGGSNGGVMAAVVAVQRPDLFRASVPQVPISDLLGRIRDPITMVSTLDYGDPSDPEMAKVLYAWSPYQNVRDGVAYPAMMIDCGSNDPRCPPWHSRKLAARMQQASNDNQPILLRVRAAAGHGAVGKTQKNQQSTEVLAFLAEQLGLAV